LGGGGKIKRKLGVPETPEAYLERPAHEWTFLWKNREKTRVNENNSENRGNQNIWIGGTAASESTKSGGLGESSLGKHSDFKLGRRRRSSGRGNSKSDG